MSEPINDGGPAFPRQPNELISGSEGMSLRDWFAGQVLAGTDITAHARGAVSTWAYEEADAMIAARKGDS